MIAEENVSEIRRRMFLKYGTKTPEAERYVPKMKLRKKMLLKWRKVVGNETGLYAPETERDMPERQ